MELMDAITHRRSVRTFTDHYVTDQKAPGRKELKSFVYLDTYGEQYGTIY